MDLFHLINRDFGSVTMFYLLGHDGDTAYGAFNIFSGSLLLKTSHMDQQVYYPAIA